MHDAQQPVLVMNSGSSSLKMQLHPNGPSLVVERIGEPSGATLRRNGVSLPADDIGDLQDAVQRCLALLSDSHDLTELRLVGHRVVHGGEAHTEPTPIDDAVLASLEALSPLAPLHNPANLQGIRVARDALPGATHVAVFDTAFHGRLPRRAFLYALPMPMYREKGIRRYGFHGTSHDYVTAQLAVKLGTPREQLRIVSLHLGNGASAAAIRHGTSVDTTMGFTPMEGLVMGTRSGDVDPGILMHLLREGTAASDLDDLLNRRSGVLGLSGVSNDLRDVWSAADDGNDDAAAALEVYAYRIRKAIAALAAAMGGLDAIVFTGGVGENDARMRSLACQELAFIGVSLDEDANARGEARITAPGAQVETWVIATDEEARIAELVRHVTTEGHPS